jgi:hypothetical protein
MKQHQTWWSSGFFVPLLRRFISAIESQEPLNISVYHVKCQTQRLWWPDNLLPFITDMV